MPSHLLQDPPKHLFIEFVDTDSFDEKILPLTPKKVVEPQLSDSEISLDNKVEFEEEEVLTASRDFDLLAGVTAFSVESKV